MITNIIIVIASIVIGIVIGVVITLRWGTEGVYRRAEKEHLARERVAFKAVGLAQKQRDIAVNELRETMIEADKLKEKFAEAKSEKEAAEFQLLEFKNQLKEAVPKLIRALSVIKTKTRGFNRVAFEKALKSLGEGDFSLKGDGYDYSKK